MTQHAPQVNMPTFQVHPTSPAVLLQVALLAARELAHMALDYSRLLSLPTITSNELRGQAEHVNAAIDDYTRLELRPGIPHPPRLAALSGLAIVCLAIGVILGSLAALLAFAVLLLRP